MKAMLPLVGRTLLLVGILIALVGAALILFSDRLGRLGHLPGDMLVQRPGFTFYFPLGTCLVASALLTLLLWLVHHGRR